MTSLNFKNKAFAESDAPNDNNGQHEEDEYAFDVLTRTNLNKILNTKKNKLVYLYRGQDSDQKVVEFAKKMK